MQTSDKFCLKWNDFKDNINATFTALRKDSYFTDVTLACEDGHQVEAHKVVLASASPFFQNILKRNIHAHPLIYMIGMKSEDLVAMVDFLYYGQANISQENLDTFLNIAEVFELKGLDGGNEREFDKLPDRTAVPNHTPQKKHVPNETSVSRQKNVVQSNSQCDDKQLHSEMKNVLPKQEFLGDTEKLEEQTRSMIGRGKNMIKVGQKIVKAYVCKVCGKEGQRNNIKEHIEISHQKGIAIPCNLCEQNLRSRSALRWHNSRIHK